MHACMGVSVVSGATCEFCMWSCCICFGLQVSQCNPVSVKVQLILFSIPVHWCFFLFPLCSADVISQTFSARLQLVKRICKIIT